MADPISVSAAEYERLKKIESAVKKAIPNGLDRTRDILVVTLDAEGVGTFYFRGSKDCIAIALGNAMREDEEAFDIVYKAVDYVQECVSEELDRMSGNTAENG